MLELPAGLPWTLGVPWAAVMQDASIFDLTLTMQAVFRMY